MDAVWYRYEATQYAGGIDEWGDPDGSIGPVSVTCWRMPVLRTTPKGVVLRDHGGGDRLVCHHWRKKYASPTKEQAFKDYMARKERHLLILEARADQVRRFIAAGKLLEKQGLPDNVYLYHYQLQGLMK